MTDVLVPDAAHPVGQLGGNPLVPNGFRWPDCVSCDGSMTHLVQLAVDGALLTVFQCENDPGMCQDWEPFAGGNAAVVFRDATVRVPAPESALSYLPILVGVDRVDADYSAIDDEDVFGQFGGEPTWIQNDETPICPNCPAGPMRFVAQLDPGPHQFNFGDYGRAYLFDCSLCSAAAWLWQS
jgi:hypothetical protein